MSIFRDLLAYNTAFTEYLLFISFVITVKMNTFYLVSVFITDDLHNLTAQYIERALHSFPHCITQIEPFRSFDTLPEHLE